jgi:stearoyl-CoA desaturase (delta-9 desaturase)
MLPSWLHYLFLSFSCLTVMGSPISWAAIHRYHHKTSDTPADPHSYHHLGIKAILLGEYNKQTALPKALFRDLLQDPFLKWLHKHYFKLLLAWAALLFCVHPLLLIFAFCVPVVMVYWATSLGIVLNHAWGYRNYSTPDRSVNSWILSLMTLGDGWHNNHHFRPNHYSHRVKWWEFDVCALIIFFVRRRDERSLS